MTAVVRQKTVFVNPVLADGALVTPSTHPTANTNVTLTKQAAQVRLARLTFTDFVVSMAAANNFGGTKVCDLPTTHLIIVGVSLSLTATVAGLATNTVASVDIAVGTTTTASVDFSNAGEDNLMAKVDGVGAAATGTITGQSATAETNISLAAGAKAIYLNMSSPVTTGTGTVTVDGYLDVYYLDLGSVS